MKVEFADRDLEDRWEDMPKAARAWGDVVAKKYILRVNAIQEAKDLHTLLTVRALRVHALKGGRTGQYAMTLHDRWRLVFSLLSRESVRIDEVSNHYDD